MMTILIYQYIEDHCDNFNYYHDRLHRGSLTITLQDQGGVVDIADHNEGDNHPMIQLPLTFTTIGVFKFMIRNPPGRVRHRRCRGAYTLA